MILFRTLDMGEDKVRFNTLAGHQHKFVFSNIQLALQLILCSRAYSILVR